MVRLAASLFALLPLSASAALQPEPETAGGESALEEPGEASAEPGEASALEDVPDAADAPVEEPAVVEDPPAAEEAPEGMAAPADGDPAVDDGPAVDDPVKPEFPPKHSLYYGNTTALRLNPLGLENRLQIDYRWRVYDNTTSKLKKGSYIAFGVEPLLNPAITRLSAVLTVQPLAVLQLRAAYGMLAHFGTFDYMQSYNTPTAEHYTAELEATTDNRYGSVGGQAQLAALLQAKVGPIAIRNNFQAYRTDINLPDNDGDGRKDTVFYYIRDDIMIQGNGWHLINDSDILFVSNFGLTAGVRATVVKPIYKKEAFLPGEANDDPNGPTFRVGPLLAYTFFDRPGKRFNKPAILLISQWWVKHRYRVSGSPETSSDGTVERGSLGDSLAGMPTLVLGFTFQGQLWGKN